MHERVSISHHKYWLLKVNLSSASIFAADNTATAAKTDVFKQAEQLYAAKNYSAKIDALERVIRLAISNFFISF
jgi:hypothetical protein